MKQRRKPAPTLESKGERYPLRMFQSAEHKVTGIDYGWRWTVSGFEPPNRLNGPQSRTWRARWGKGKDLAEKFDYLLVAARPLPSFKGKVALRYWRTYRSQPLDEDALSASVKPILDALVRAKVIEDDDPAHVDLSCDQGPRYGGPARFMVSLEPSGAQV